MPLLHLSAFRSSTNGRHQTLFTAKVLSRPFQPISCVWMSNIVIWSLGNELELYEPQAFVHGDLDALHDCERYLPFLATICH